MQPSQEEMSIWARPYPEGFVIIFVQTESLEALVFRQVPTLHIPGGYYYLNHNMEYMSRKNGLLLERTKEQGKKNVVGTQPCSQKVGSSGNKGAPFMAPAAHLLFNEA
jgi:hypothetical protein